MAGRNYKFRYETIQEAAAECLKYFVRESSLKSHKLSNPEESANFIVLSILASGSMERENVGVICLNASNTVVHVEILSVGTVNHAACYPREVAKTALLANATAVVLFHNHPGGQAVGYPFPFEKKSYSCGNTPDISTRASKRHYGLRFSHTRHIM